LIIKKIKIISERISICKKQRKLILRSYRFANLIIVAYSVLCDFLVCSFPNKFIVNKLTPMLPYVICELWKLGS